MRSGRGVGYCMNRVCDLHGRGRVLSSGASTYVCGRCGWVGKTEYERGQRLGKHEIVSEVRVEFAFDPEREIYTRSIVVNEERLLRSQAVYVLQTPLIESPELACSVGRAVLKRLNERALGRVAARHATREQLRAQGWATLV